MTIYTHNPDVVHLFELEQQVRHLKSELARTKTMLTTERLRASRARQEINIIAQSAADEINRSTRANVERIRDLLTYITFLERNDREDLPHVL